MIKASKSKEAIDYDGRARQTVSLTSIRFVYGLGGQPLCVSLFDRGQSARPRSGAISMRHNTS